MATVHPLHKQPQFRPLTQRERRALAVRQARDEIVREINAALEDLQRQHNRLVVTVRAQQRLMMRHLHRHSEIALPGQPSIIGIPYTELNAEEAKVANELWMSLACEGIADCLRAWFGHATAEGRGEGTEPPPAPEGKADAATE